MMDRRTFAGGMGGILAAGVSRSAQAQQRSTPPLLAILSPSAKVEPGPSGGVYAAFRNGVEELGYTEGRNISIVERFSDGAIEKLPSLAADLVATKPNVLFTWTSPAARAAAAATQTVPIVVGAAGEREMIELAGNLARPVNNVTGLTLVSQELDEKCLQLLKEAVPATSRVAVLMNPLNTAWQRYLAALDAAARALGIALVHVEARRAEDIAGVFGKMEEERVDGLFVVNDATLTGHAEIRNEILRRAAAHRMPVVSSSQSFGRAGGLIGFGTDTTVLGRRAAMYVDKILKGAIPAELPIERPVRFDLVVNLETAKALGLTLPPSILLRADEVIE
jgi:putative tryptophan/tyrosine transport system substrate-binding protein